MVKPVSVGRFWSLDHKLVVEAGDRIARIWKWDDLDTSPVIAHLKRLIRKATAKGVSKPTIEQAIRVWLASF